MAKSIAHSLRFILSSSASPKRPRVKVPYGFFILAGKMKLNQDH